MSASCSIAPDSRRSRELRPLVGARLGRARELRQRDHRHVQLLGQPLQRAADRRDLLLAVLDAAGARDELQVVDDHQAEAVLGLQAAALGAHLERRERGRVVDEDAATPTGRRRPWPAAPSPSPAACRCAAGARRRARRRRACAARAAPSTSRARRSRPSRRCASAAFCAMFRQNDVLPIAGRAATMIRSPFCRPLVFSSRSTKPVGRPVTSSFDCESWSMVRKLSLTISRIGRRSPGGCGARRSRRSPSRPGRGSRRPRPRPRRHDCTMRLPAWIRFRRTAFSLMMRLHCSTFVMRGTPSTSEAR